MEYPEGAVAYDEESYLEMIRLDGMDILTPIIYGTWSGLGGALAVWPAIARAQLAAKPPTIGFLGSSTPQAMSGWTAAFVQRLRELGWIEGRTVAIEYRWAEGRSERYAEIAAEFARLGDVDALVVTELANASEVFAAACTSFGANRVYAPALLRLRVGPTGLAESEVTP